MSLLADSAWESKARKTPPGMADISGGALPGVVCHQCRFFRFDGGLEDFTEEARRKARDWL